MAAQEVSSQGGPRPAGRPARSWSIASSQASRLLALCAAGYGLLSIMRGSWPGRFHDDNPPGLALPRAEPAVASALTVGLGLVVVLVAHGLARRKRRAWLVAVVALTLLAGLEVLHGHHPIGIAIAVALLITLVACGGQFTGQVDATMRGAAGLAAAAVLLVGVVVGMSTLAIAGAHLTGPTSIGSRIRTVFRGFVGMSGPTQLVGSRHEAQFVLTMVTCTVIGVALAAYLLMRSAEPAPHRTPDDERVVDDLLRRFGGQDSLSYFARRGDKSVVLSPTGKAAITYRVLAGTAVVSADPLGDPEAWPAAITCYLELCRRNSWVPAVLGCSAQAARTFARHGLAVLEIGDEALIAVDEFTLDGRAMRNVRQMVNRVSRLGYQAQVHRLADLSSDERADLRRLAAQWRIGHVERGYSMALGTLGGPDCIVVVATTTDGDGESKTRALLQFVPWGDDGWSLDLMRRDPAADPGMNDFLIVTALRAAGRFGVRRVSLNFAMLRQAFAQGERLGAGWAARGWAALLRPLSRWYQLDSLYRFNAKFGPTWVPRYLCYRGLLSLPRVAYAAMEAEAFVRRPPLLRRLAGTTVLSGTRVVRLRSGSATKPTGEALI